MATIAKWMVWLKLHAGAVLSAVVSVVIALFAWRKRQERELALKDQLEIERAQRQIKVAEAKREFLVKRYGEATQEATLLAERIAEQKKRIVEVATSNPIPEGISNAELDRRLSDLGY